MTKKSKMNTTYLQDREYVLAKNIREELNVIPDNYVIEYYPKKDDVSSLIIEVPNVISVNGKKTPYPLFEQILHRRHILVKKNDECLERFVIEEIEEIESNDSKIKTATAYSYDYTLKTKACLVGEGLTRQLYCPKDENIHVGEGILNIFESQTGWKVNHIDDMARHEEVVENASMTNNISGKVVLDKVTDNMTLLDMDITIPHEEGFPLSFDIAWVDLNVTTADGFSYNSGSIIHSFSNYHNSVAHIKATFTSNSIQRYGITYELTFADGTTETVVNAFVNCRNLTLSIKEINLTYLTSQEENKRVVKYRYLEYSQSYWYQYLKTTVQDAYDVYISFDSYNKTINVYDKEQFGRSKGFYLDFNNLLTKITKQSDSSELCTRLWIQSNNVDITEVNPLGTSYIEDYSYFERDNTMSNSLRNALKRYYEHIQVQQDKWSEISKLKNANDQWLTKRNSELTSLNEQVKAKQALLVAYLKTNNGSDGQQRVAQELKELELQVVEKLGQIDQLKAQSDEYLSQMQLIGKQMSKETSEDLQGKIFTSIDIEELNDLTIEQTYTDEFYTKALGLFEYAKKVMESKTKLTYEFSLEHEELVSGIKHPLGWEWFVEIGAKVEIPDKDLADKDGFVSIYAYKYSPKNKIIESVEFNNDSAVTKAIKGLASFSKVAYDTANMTDFWKETWKESENATAIVSDIRKNGLDLSANIVRGGNTVNKISMTESGVFIIDAENDDNQIYIGSSLIAITTDRWFTSKTAIDQGGIIADTIIGRLLLGEELFLSNEDGSFMILPNKISIKDNLQEEVIGIGIGDTGNTYLHLGKNTDNSYLIFNENGELNIKASSLKLTTGEIPTLEELSAVKNESFNYTNSQLSVLENSITTRVETVEQRQGVSEDGLQELHNWKSYAEQKITDDSIISTVSQTVETAKTEAIDIANSSTDGKLINYYTKTESESQIDQKANKIALSVSKNEINNLQINSTNLLLNSDEGKQLDRAEGVQYNQISYELIDDYHGLTLNNDMTFVLSFMVDRVGNTDFECFDTIAFDTGWNYRWSRNDIDQIIYVKGVTYKFIMKPKVIPKGHKLAEKLTFIAEYEYGGGLFYNAMLTEGGKALGWSPAFKDIENSIAKIELKSDEINLSVNQIKENLTNNHSTTSQMNTAINQKADSILSTVSTSYATKDNLNNYSTTSQMNSAINQRANEINLSVEETYVTKGDVNNTFATKSELTQTSTSLTAVFSEISGGGNLVANGDFLNGRDNWWVWGGCHYYLDSTPNCSTGAMIGANTIGGFVSSQFRLKPNTKYTFSCDAYAEQNVISAYATIEMFDGSSQNQGVAFTIGLSRDANNRRIVHQFTTGAFGTDWTGQIMIKHEGSRVASMGYLMVVNNVCLTEGYNSGQFVPATRALYEGVLRADKDGLTVTHSVDSSYSKMGATGFEYYANGSGHRYHNLMRQGWIDTISFGGIGSIGWATSVSLPDEFKNKPFSVIPCITYVGAPNVADAIKMFEVNVPHNEVNYANGTFKVYIYASGLWAEGLSTTYSVEVRATWIAIA